MLYRNTVNLLSVQDNMLTSKHLVICLSDQDLRILTLEPKVLLLTPSTHDHSSIIQSLKLPSADVLNDSIQFMSFGLSYLAG